LSDYPALRIDRAAPADCEEIVTLIGELAEYERLAHEVQIDPTGLEDHLFGPRPFAEAILARSGDRTAGFALFFHNYSTFVGKPGLYLEDLFVRPQYRGTGIGQAMLRYLASVAVDRDCGRFEWAVLDWNEDAIRFYRKLGAVPMDEWTVFRLAGPALQRLASSAGP
jgi:GNAT superfamily N-acetyltransferase